MKIKTTQKSPNKRNRNKEIMSYSEKYSLVKKEVLGIDITDAKKEKVLKYIVDSVENSSKNYYITTPNPEMVVYAASHPNSRAILNGAEIALCDGVGLLWGAQVLGKPLKGRFTGVELVEMLCENVANQPITVGFFGGKPDVAENAAECLTRRYPKLKVVFANDTWSEGRSGHKEVASSMYQVVSREKRKSSILPTTNYQLHPTDVIDILFVALGFPKQEEWMASHVNKVPVRVMVGVGGAFDYISGRVTRAPEWVQNIGLEWLFRLIVQPWRLKRQLALPQFVWMVAKERFFPQK